MQRWVHAEKRRHYTLHLGQDLLGDWVLVRSWGSLDSQRGQVSRQLVGDWDKGLEALEAAHKRRHARGYQPVS
ncbi:MAG TPA: hypothetical protein EYP51_06735 [Thiotrichales bacterium]|nr:hypothetical protein [Thiotrichales bacterium]